MAEAATPERAPEPERAPDPRADPGERVSLREAAAVALALLVVHLVLFLELSPLPHSDLQGYVEPAYHLAKEGTLRAPGSQYVDLTYQLRAYFILPGFSLMLGTWLWTFGMGVRSLLAFTHVVHATYLGALWFVARNRLGATRIVASLLVISAFPRFNHGRPDVAALLFGTLGWLAAPRKDELGRSFLSGLFLGAAVLVSLPFGASSAAVVGLDVLVRPRERWRPRIAAALVLAGTAVLVVLATTAAVLAAQGHPELAFQQLPVHARLRGGQLNTLPDLRATYAIVFGIVPLALTLLPAAFLLTRFRDPTERPLLTAARIYVGGFLVWFAINRGPLVFGNHFTFLGRPALHGALLSSPRRGWRIAGAVLLVPFTLLSFYHDKDTFLALANGTIVKGYEDVASMRLDPAAVVAVDSMYLPLLYRDEKTICYESMWENYWESYRDATSPAALALLPEERRKGPVLPSTIVVSSITLDRLDVPDPRVWELASGEMPIERATILGKSVRFPARPLAVHVYVRKPQR
ncbi:hypothetical protein HY251_11900 [bacterium]|nr:hypothetical protein [bacterium]